MRMAVEGDAKQVKGFPLIPVGVGEQAGHRRQVQVLFGQGHLEHNIAITIDGDQVVEHGEIRRRQSLAVGTQTLVHTVQVKQHHIGLGQLSQERHHLQQLLALDPYHRHSGAGRLNAECLRAKAVTQLPDNRIVKMVVGLPRRHLAIVRRRICHNFLSPRIE